MKISKTEAKYSNDAGTKPCRACSMFRAPSSCTAVEGSIAPDATCKLWEAKTEKRKTLGKLLTEQRGSKNG